MPVQGKNRHYRWKEIHARHWLETAKRRGFGEMKTIIQDAIDKTPEIVKRVRGIIPWGFPAPDRGFNPGRISARAGQLAAELSG